MNNHLDVNPIIIRRFDKKARALQDKGEKGKYRALSYYRAAQAIRRLDRGLDEIYQASWLAGLQKIKGIGNRLAHEIEQELKKLGVSK